MRKYPFVLVSILLFASACGGSLPTLEGVDLVAWKKDKNGCGGERAKSIPALEQQTAKLKGLSEMETIQLLGRPDRNELYSRNQKFYHYFLEPGAPCGKDQEPKELSVRFTATGFAQEIIVE